MSYGVHKVTPVHGAMWLNLNKCLVTLKKVKEWSRSNNSLVHYFIILADWSKINYGNHSEVVCHRTNIVRLSFDYRTISYDIVRYRTISYDIVRFTYDLASHQAIIVKSYVIVQLSFDCRTMSYDLATISQTLPMRRKPMVSNVTTKLRLQCRSRVGANFRNLRRHPSHDVAGRYDQGFTSTAEKWLHKYGTYMHMSSSKDVRSPVDNDASLWLISV